MKTNTLKELYKPGEKKQNETELMLLQCYYQYAVLIIHWWDILWLLGLVLLITDFNSLLEITYTVKTYYIGVGHCKAELRYNEPI